MQLRSQTVAQRFKEPGCPAQPLPINLKYQGTLGIFSLPHTLLAKENPLAWKLGATLFFQSFCISFPSSPSSIPKRRMPLLLSTQPVILLSDLSQEVSVVTDCLRIAPLG